MSADVDLWAFTLIHAIVDFVVPNRFKVAPRSLFREHFVHDYTKAVDVYLRRVVVLEDFWCHVCWRSHSHSQGFVRTAHLRGNLRQAKVSNHSELMGILSYRVDEAVVRFEVAVDNVVLVEERDTACHIPYDFQLDQLSQASFVLPENVCEVP